MAPLDDNPVEMYILWTIDDDLVELFLGSIADDLYTQLYNSIADDAPQHKETLPGYILRRRHQSQLNRRCRRWGAAASSQAVCLLVSFWADKPG